MATYYPSNPEQTIDLIKPQSPHLKKIIYFLELFEDQLKYCMKKIF